MKKKYPNCLTFGMPYGGILFIFRVYYDGTKTNLSEVICYKEKKGWRKELPNISALIAEFYT